MTWSDPIVDEVRRAREAYAARFNYDLRAIFLDLKEQEKLGGRKLTSYPVNTSQNPPLQQTLDAQPDTGTSHVAEPGRL